MEGMQTNLLKSADQHNISFYNMFSIVLAASCLSILQTKHIMTQCSQER